MPAPVLNNGNYLGIPTLNNTANTSAGTGEAGTPQSSIPPQGSILGTIQNANIINQQNAANVNSFGVPYGAKDYAAQTQAKVAETNYANYKSTFLPLQNYLADLVNNPAYFGAQVGGAYNQFNQQFNASQGQYQRDLARYGLTQTPDQKVSQDRLQNIGQGTGRVEALNRANRGYRDLEYTILGAGAPTASTTQQLTNTTVGG